MVAIGLIQCWWVKFVFHIPQGHLVQSASELSLREAEEKLQRAEERREWEEGHMDYMGRHSFESIQKKLDQFLQWRDLSNFYRGAVKLTFFIIYYAVTAFHFNL